MLLRVCEYFTEVNIEWLLFGEGQMIYGDNEAHPKTVLSDKQAIYGDIGDITASLQDINEPRRTKLITLIKGIIDLEVDKINNKNMTNYPKK